MPRTLDALATSQRLAIAGAALFTSAAGIAVAAQASDVARFVLSALAIAALAAVVGQSVDQIGEHLGPGPTGLMQSTVGNLPELFVGIFALREGLNSVVQAALVGSVLANVLLVLGAACLTGGVRYGTQRFRPEAPRMLVTLLTLAVGAALVPTLSAHLNTPAASHTHALSDVTAGVLLLLYVASIPFWLSGGPGPKPPTEEKPSTPKRSSAGTAAAPAQPLGQPAQTHWPLGLAVIVLVLAGVASAAVSDWFSNSLLPATEALGISPEFTGLVIVAIASNAVENAVGIRLAWKARPDYAISTILNSPLQIMLFLTPVLVLVSPFIGPLQLTLVFPSLLVAALAIAVVVVVVVVYDGEYSWLEGAALIALYVIVAAAFWWG
jgi:Ca2+:H+ antiporter